MKFVHVAAVMITFVTGASAADVSGKWKVKFLGDPMKWPKMVSEMTFDLKADGTKLTGMAHMAAWPGDAEILEGKIDGDRISFVVVGKNPWWSSSSQGKASGLPRLRFTGKIEGNEMRLHVLWDSVMIYGAGGAGAEHEMAGSRVEGN